MKLISESNSIEINEAVSERVSLWYVSGHPYLAVDYRIECFTEENKNPLPKETILINSSGVYHTKGYFFFVTFSWCKLRLQKDILPVSGEASKHMTVKAAC